MKTSSLAAIAISAIALPSISNAQITKATTECRAGCQGSTTGCQESLETAVLAASKGMRLNKDSLTISRQWPGSDTAGLIKEPNWNIRTIPANSSQPVAIIIKPVLGSCEGSSGHKQSRTHYEWTVVEGPPDQP